MGATPKRSKKTPRTNSTTKPATKNKLSLKRNFKATPKLAATGCTCCDCSTQPSGGVWTCEDGVCVYVPKPSYYAVLVSDPNFVLPYWSRPTDLGLNCPTVVPLGTKKVARSKKGK